METIPQLKPLLISAGDGPEVFAFGSKIEFKLGAEETGGAITLGLAQTPPGGGPPLHVHRQDDEIFIVVEGEMEIFFDDQWHKAKGGDVFFGPKNVPHKFRNAGSTPSRHWVITLPCGFETFYKKCSEAFATGGPPDIAKVIQACKEHGNEILEQPAH